MPRGRHTLESHRRGDAILTRLPLKNFSRSSITTPQSPHEPCRRCPPHAAMWTNCRRQLPQRISNPWKRLQRDQSHQSRPRKRPTFDFTCAARQDRSNPPRAMLMMVVAIRKQSQLLLAKGQRVSSVSDACQHPPKTAVHSTAFQPDKTHRVISHSDFAA